MTLIEFDYQTLAYSENQSIQTMGAIDLIFFNAGTAIVTVDGFPVAPNTSFGVTGNVGEVISQRDRTVQFDAVGIPLVYVTRRFYTGKIINR